ncbi:hypothetical protein F5Y07DRAFT_376425 [Xylaria sp. FL0933]|nr:hypothetical protein F5Y07DRAFT_376425 [Xylaria sp. FL0933]
MISVEIPTSEVAKYLDKLDLPECKGAVHIACCNSPYKCTLSGPEKFIDALKRASRRTRSFHESCLKPARELPTSPLECEIPTDYTDFCEYWAAHRMYRGSSLKLLQDIVWDGVSHR